MAQYDDEYDYETEEELSGSDLVKKLRKQVNEMSKALKERDEQLQEYFSVSREQELAEALTEYGVNPKVAAFIPDDVEDEDDLVDWLNTYGEVFGYGATDNASGGISVDQEAIHAAELMSAVEEGGIDPSVGQDLAARMAAANTPEELAALLKG